MLSKFVMLFGLIIIGIGLVFIGYDIKPLLNKVHKNNQNDTDYWSRVPSAYELDVLADKKFKSINGDISSENLDRGK